MLNVHLENAFWMLNVHLKNDSIQRPSTMRVRPHAIKTFWWIHLIKIFDSKLEIARFIDCSLRKMNNLISKIDIESLGSCSNGNAEKMRVFTQIIYAYSLVQGEPNFLNYFANLKWRVLLNLKTKKIGYVLYPMLNVKFVAPLIETRK